MRAEGAMLRWNWLGAARPWGLALVALAFAQSASAATCDATPPVPDALQPADRVQSYQSTLQVCTQGDSQRLAIRKMSIDGEPALLLADPKGLSTSLQRAACWTCQDASEEDFAATRMMRSIAKSAEAPGLERRGFLQNAGLTHGAGERTYFTGDLCPSRHALDRDFLRDLETPGQTTPIGLSISGLWLKHHFADYRWLRDQEAEGGLAITWINHTYTHPYERGVGLASNFLLEPGVDPDYEIMETERLLIANGGVPSLFFRFPGLVSDSPLMQAVRQHRLISLGADAWLALNEKPGPGSIVLVHPNGNEPRGLKLYARDEAKGLIPKPLSPIASAP